MVIRSHECVRTGFCLHYQNDFETAVCAPGTPLVCTIFSASNYCNGDNFGAYITILPHKFSDSQPVGKSGLYYAVHRFKTSSAEIALEVTNRMSLSGLIVRKKNALRMSFQAIDKGNVGQVTCLLTCFLPFSPSIAASPYTSFILSSSHSLILPFFCSFILFSSHSLTLSSSNPLQPSLLLPPNRYRKLSGPTLCCA